MQRARRWLLAGAIGAVLLVPVGEDAQAALLLVAGIGAIASVRRGVRTWSPPDVFPWYGLAAAIGTFLAAGVVREVEVAVAGQVTYPAFADLLDALAYVITVAAILRLGHLRSDRRDPTNLVDALIVVGGIAALVWVVIFVPYLSDDSFPLAARAVDACFFALSLVMGVATARIAVGPGLKNQSYYLLAAAVTGAFGADLLGALDQALREPFPGQSSLDLLLPTLAFLAVGAAAASPAMVELTTPVAVAVGKMTPRRLALMITAVVIPPATLAVDAGDGELAEPFVLVAVWLGISTLVVIRLAGLVRAREQAEHLEAVLRRAAASLVAATGPEQVHAVAMDATREVLDEGVGAVRPSVVAGDGERWTTVAGSGAGRAVDDERVLRAVRAGSSPTVLGRIGLPGDPEAVVTTVPLVSRNELRGALLVATTEPPDPAAVDAMQALGADVSLALESLALADEISRRRSEQALRAMIENSSDIVVVVEGGRTTFVSPAMHRVLGYTADSYLTSELLTMIHSDDRAAAAAVLQEGRTTSDPVGPYEVRAVDAAGRVRWFEMTVSALQAGTEAQVINAREVTDRVAAEAELRRSESRYRALAQHSSDLVLVLDAEGGVTYASPSAEQVLGHAPDALLGAGFHSLVLAEDRTLLLGQLPLLASAGRSTRTVELRVHHLSGVEKCLELAVTDLRDDPSVGGIVLNAHDITERKSLEHDLRHRALHDDLTGLANRVLFRERVEHALTRRQVDGTVTAICFVDLDDFKTVNDGLGHDVGDELLQVVARRLGDFVRTADTAARLGGDEFALLFEDTEREDALAVAERLVEVLREPLEVRGRTLVVGASIGVAFAEHDATADVVLRNADAAMYHAKRTGKGSVHVFAESMYLSAFERLELKADLAGALERDELHVEYQPLVSLRSGAIVGFEALLRWEHPERGRISPAAFVPIAEQTGDIVPIGSWVLRTACEQLRQWQARAGGVVLTMSVNLSPRQLTSPDVVGDVESILRDTGIDAQLVTLELTEGIRLDAGPSRDHLLQLRELGVGLAADDFGAGFASYASLQELPFTSVKIDRTIIEGLDREGSDGSDKATAQVRSIVTMAHATGLHVVAEGIERAGQQSALVALGCDVGQGYHLASPAPPGAVELLLDTGPAALAAPPTNGPAAPEAAPLAAGAKGRSAK